MVALRAKQLDVWAADFLDHHPDAVVLHLGCGLDSRVFRLDPPATVQWFDVDQPAVIELRRKLYSDRDGYQMIASSVTEPAWLESIPADRPALVVAEGLLMYLTEAEARQLLQRITDRFGSGELLTDLLSQWGPRISKLIEWGARDGRELADWNPRLRYIEQTSAIARLREDPAEAAAHGVPDAARDTGAPRLRPAVPVSRTSYCCDWAVFSTSMPSGDSARTASSRIKPRSSAVLNSTAISWAVRRPCGRSQR